MPAAISTFAISSPLCCLEQAATSRTQELFQPPKIMAPRYSLLLSVVPWMPALFSVSSSSCSFWYLRPLVLTCYTQGGNQEQDGIYYLVESLLGPTV